jgi:tRNA pseudouridine(55) synthase
MHSALKFEGKRLYELARRGQSVEREPRQIFIHRIARVRLERDELEFDVYCSKGTYIRTLAADIAARLGTLGYVRGQFGKNHLGDRAEFLPTAHGFDEFFGNLYHLNAEEEPENPD